MKKILLFGLVTSVVVYLFLLVMFFRANRAVDRSFNHIEHYISEIERANALELTLRKAETDVKSYLLSGDREFIKDMHNDRAYVDSCISFIWEFVKSDPVQLARINELKRLIERRRWLYDLLLQRYDKGAFQLEDVLQLTRTHGPITRDIRKVLNEIVDHEQMFLAREKEKLRSYKMQSYSLAAATGFFPLVITFFTIYALTDLLKERERLGRRLNRLLENKDKFITIIGHDLKGPASAIKLMAQVLLDQKGKLSEEQEMKMKERLASATSNHVKLLEDLVAWAKTQTQTIEFCPDIIDLQAIVEDATLRITEMAVSKNISISHSFTSPVPVYADEQMIKTVMRNLLQNAVKFTPRNGSVKVGFRIIDKMIEVSVADTGIGVPADKVDKLFSPGSKVGSKGTEGEPGTGLGLILCKEFVKKHGGSIWVESDIGKGSVFYFTLPLPR